MEILSIQRQEKGIHIIARNAIANIFEISLIVWKLRFYDGYFFRVGEQREFENTCYARILTPNPALLHKVCSVFINAQTIKLCSFEKNIHMSFLKSRRAGLLQEIEKCIFLS